MAAGAKKTPLAARVYETLFNGNIKSLDTFNSAGALAPNILSDAENVFYDTGYIYNRYGAQVAYADSGYAPTTPITQIITVSDSHGTQYLLRFWNGVFDVWNSTTKTWFNLNPTTNATGYTSPKITQLSSKWGYASWNSGWGNDVNTVISESVGADLLYLGNGTDPFCRWIVANTTLAVALNNGDTSITAVDTSQFPGNTNALTQNLLIDGTVISYTKKTPSSWTSIYTGTASLPSDGDSFSFTINGHTTTGHFVTTIGAAGDVKIRDTVLHQTEALLALLQAPNTTDTVNGYWQGWTNATDIANIQLIQWSGPTSSNITINGSEFDPGSITTFTATVSTSGYTNVTYAPNVFTLSSAWSGTTQAIGTQLYSPMVSVSNGGNYVIGGKYIAVINQRMHWAGVSGYETFFYYSALQMPEVSGPIGAATGIAAGGEVELSDADGPITALSVTMQYVLIYKKDLINEFYLTEDTTNNDNIPTFVPIQQGDSVGSVSGFLTKTVNLVSYYPTTSQGIVELIPSFSYTGNVVFQQQIISIPIQNIATDAGYQLGDAIYYDSKFHMSVNESGSPTIPNLIIYYDLITKAWGKIRGWNATSFVEFNGDLLFSSIDSNVYQMSDVAYDDNGFGYDSYAQSAELAFGDEAILKNEDSLYVTGLISLGGKLYVDVMMNKAGTLQTDTYLISGDPSKPYIQSLLMPTIGQNMIGVNTIGVANNDSNIGAFKVYLTQNIQYWWNTVQLKFYSTDPGTAWMVDSSAIHVTESESVNPELVVYINT